MRSSRQSGAARGDGEGRPSSRPPSARPAHALEAPAISEARLARELRPAPTLTREGVPRAVGGEARAAVEDSARPLREAPGLRNLRDPRDGRAEPRAARVSHPALDPRADPRADPRGAAPSKPYRHEPPARRVRRRIAAALRPAARFTAVGGTWLVAIFVVAYAGGLRLFGEDWWVTTVALYLPHWVLLGPIGALALVTLMLGPRRLLLLHAGASLVVLFPLMGLALGGATEGQADAPRLRIVSYNVGSGARSIPGIVAQIKHFKPDLVLLQESSPEVNAAVAAGFPGYATLASTQFFFVSRGALSELLEPPKVPLPGKDGASVDRSPRFVRATVETALGKLEVYNIHPISPREALTSIHDNSFLGSLRTGDHHIITENTALRRLQAEAIVALAAASTRPVLLAGDTNLPQSSRILAGTLGRWRDGFEEVGRGLGYTFPVTRRGPWMRIDRIFADERLRFLQFGTGESAASDHHCVWAELELVTQ